MTEPLIDFAAAWRAALERDPHGRLDAARDQAFWRDYAPHYDARTAMPGSYTNTLQTLTALVQCDDTLLDVGAGTGRFALPLSSHVRHVTALDHAAAMLHVLQTKLIAHEIQNVSWVEAAWEDAEIMPHDVVLAAWSLYRQRDLPAALHKLVHATRRTLVIVASDTFAPPHRSLVEAIWGPVQESSVPVYLYILGTLRQLDVRADLRMVHETRRYHAATPEGIARQLAPPQARDPEIARFADRLVPLLEQHSGGWHYAHAFPVGMIIWHRSTL